MQKMTGYTRNPDQQADAKFHNDLQRISDRVVKEDGQNMASSLKFSDDAYNLQNTDTCKAYKARPHEYVNTISLTA